MAGSNRSAILEGMDRLQRLSAKLFNGPDSPAMLRPALVLERRIKITLSQPGHGRLYPSRANKGRYAKWLAKGKKGRRPKPIMHRASAPGEPPSVDLGDLRRSIGHEANRNSIRVGSSLERSIGLEFGVKKKHLAERPFMRPSIERALKEMRSEAPSLVVELQARGKRIVER